MSLKIQIISLIYSFFYGAIFYILVRLNKKFLYNNKYAFIIDALFILDNVLLYFILLRHINNGVFHIYFLCMLILGYILVYYVDKKIHN